LLSIVASVATVRRGVVRGDLRAAILVEGLSLVDVLRPCAAVELRVEDVRKDRLVERPAGGFVVGPGRRGQTGRARQERPCDQFDCHSGVQYIKKNACRGVS